MIRPKIILITDPAYDEATILDVIEKVGSALPHGALAVQLRDKTRPFFAMRDWAMRLRALTARKRVGLILNGDAANAAELGAEGVHLGSGTAASIERARAEYGDSLWISVAVHSDDDVRRACRQGAHAVLVSPVFAVPEKGKARGVRAIETAAGIAQGAVDVYALGGVTAEDAAVCAAAGAQGVAAIRALLSSRDPVQAALSMYDAIEAYASGSCRSLPVNRRFLTNTCD